MKLIVKMVTWLLLMALFFIHDFACNDSLLDKFHQNGYKFKDVRAELMSYNKKCFNFFEVKTFKHNRTTPAINCSVNFKITVKDQLEVVVQGLKFLSNEYRHFPIRYQVNLKKAVKANVMGVQNWKSCGNVIEMYFEKDITYYICNFVMDETHYPPLIPNGRYRFDNHLMYLNKECAVLSGFAEVYTPIAYPKN